MTLPKELIETFERESNDFKFGKLSITMVKRGGHFHFELDKHITIMAEDDSAKKTQKDDIKSITDQQNFPKSQSNTITP
jgi:hypothetical protein